MDQNTPSTEEQTLCEYCGTYHSTIVPKLFCYMIKAIYLLIDCLKAIGF